MLPHVRRVLSVAKSLAQVAGGGFLLFYCPQERQRALRSTLAQSGLQEMPFDFDFVGPQMQLWLLLRVRVVVGWCH